MSFIRRAPRTWPYAANSTGRPRGTLNLGYRVGRVQVFEAVGDARDIFIKKLSGAVVKHLDDSADTLQDSASSVDLSLFMMGKSVQRTKPFVMFVSKDKAARLEAFRMIMKSDIMKDYPGFELGHMDLKAEYENLQPLADGGTPSTDFSVHTVIRFSKMTEHYGHAFDSRKNTKNCVKRIEEEGLVMSEEGAEVFTLESGSWNGRRLLIRRLNGSTVETRSATAGGILSYNGSYFLHSVNHFLDPTDAKQPAPLPRQPSSVADDSEDCELTGLSDFEDIDDEDELVDVTSRGSLTPESNTSEAHPLDSDDKDDSDFSLGSVFDQAEHFTAVQSRLKGLTELENPQSVARKDGDTKIGDVIWSSPDLDSSLIRIDLELASGLGLTESQLQALALPLEDYSAHIEDGPRDAAIRTTTPDGGTIGGSISGTPSFVRLPRSKAFQEVYVGRLNRPLVPGDCGSWVRDAVSGKVFGHVIAGSPTTGLAWVMPARVVFAQAAHILDSWVHVSGTSSTEKAAPVLPALPSHMRGSRSPAEDRGPMGLVQLQGALNGTRTGPSMAAGHVSLVAACAALAARALTIAKALSTLSENLKTMDSSVKSLTTQLKLLNETLTWVQKCLEHWASSEVPHQTTLEKSISLCDSITADIERLVFRLRPTLSQNRKALPNWRLYWQRLHMMREWERQLVSHLGVISLHCNVLQAPLLWRALEPRLLLDRGTYTESRDKYGGTLPPGAVARLPLETGVSVESEDPYDLRTLWRMLKAVIRTHPPTPRQLWRDHFTDHFKEHLRDHSRDHANHEPPGLPLAWNAWDSGDLQSHQSRCSSTVDACDDEDDSDSDQEKPRNFSSTRLRSFFDDDEDDAGIPEKLLSDGSPTTHINQTSATTAKPRKRVPTATQKYWRPKHPKLQCTHPGCAERPGFRGEHELRRHMDSRHRLTVVKYHVCFEPRDTKLRRNRTLAGVPQSWPKEAVDDGEPPAGYLGWKSEARKYYSAPEQADLFVVIFTLILSTSTFLMPLGTLAALGSAGTILVLYPVAGVLIFCSFSCLLEFGLAIPCSIARSGDERNHLEKICRQSRSLATGVVVAAEILQRVLVCILLTFPAVYLLALASGFLYSLHPWVIGGVVILLITFNAVMQQPTDTPCISIICGLATLAGCFVIPDQGSSDVAYAGHTGGDYGSTRSLTDAAMLLSVAFGFCGWDMVQYVGDPLGTATILLARVDQESRRYMPWYTGLINGSWVICGCAIISSWFICCCPFVDPDIARFWCLWIVPGIAFLSTLPLPESPRRLMALDKYKQAAMDHAIHRRLASWKAPGTFLLSVLSRPEPPRRLMIRDGYEQSAMAHAKYRLTNLWRARVDKAPTVEEIRQSSLHQAHPEPYHVPIASSVQLLPHCAMAVVLLATSAGLANNFIGTLCLYSGSGLAAFAGARHIYLHSRKRASCGSTEYMYLLPASILFILFAHHFFARVCSTVQESPGGMAQAPSGWIVTPRGDSWSVADAFGVGAGILIASVASWLLMREARANLKVQRTR